MIVELLLALLAGVVGGIASRWIPLRKKLPLVYPEVDSSHKYMVTCGPELFYEGGDLRMAKARRQENPGAVLIADGVNRG